jgi:hypothetical protein
LMPRRSVVRLATRSKLRAFVESDIIPAMSVWMRVMEVE